MLPFMKELELNQGEPRNDHDPENGARETRSSVTRNKLLDATYRILREVGHAGLRSGSVADVSGVSRGGLLHHFPTKEALVAALFERITEEFEEASWARIRSCPDDQLLEVIVEDARSRFFSPAYKVMLDILVASAEEQPLAEIRAALAARLKPTAREGWAQRLTSLGLDAEAADRLTLFLWNIVKGLAVRNLVQEDQSLGDRVIALGLELAHRRFDRLLKVA